MDSYFIYLLGQIKILKCKLLFLSLPYLSNCEGYTQLWNLLERSSDLSNSGEFIRQTAEEIAM